MSKVGTRTKLIILIAVIAVLVVCIFLAVNKKDTASTDNPGEAAATTEQVQDQGLVIEDSATVQVELSDEEKAAADEKSDEAEE
jgi:anti-sigma-K factor RskA